MDKFRLLLGLALLGLAGAMAVGASAVGDDGVVAWLALWIGAAYLAWNGIRAFQGRIPLPRTQTADPEPPEPSAAPAPPAPREDRPLDPYRYQPSARTDARHVVKTAATVVEDAVLFMRRATVVLALALLAPAALGLFTGGLVLLVQGEATAVLLFLAAGFLGWYCLGPLRSYWPGDETPRTTGTETGTGGAAGGDPATTTTTTTTTVTTATTVTAPAGAEPVPAPPSPPLTLPEEFLLLCHLPTGEVHDRAHAALGSAAAELGELALRRRLRIVPTKKIKIFGFEAYFMLGTIHLLDTTATGLAWADALLAELERHEAARGKPVSLRTWFRLRRDEALTLHRDALVGRTVLLPDHRGDLHYPDAALRTTLISTLQAVNSERAAMDEHTLLLLDLLDGAGLEEHLGLTLSMRRRLDRARGTGAVAAIPEHMRDTSTVLSIRMPTGSKDGNGDGDGDGGE